MSFFDPAVWRMPRPVSDDLLPSIPEQEETCFGWDYEGGDLLLDGAGNVVMLTGEDAWRQWVTLAVMTTRATYIAFDRLHGANLDALRREGDPRIKEQMARRTFMAAALQHPDTARVEVALVSEEDTVMVLSIKAWSTRGAEATAEVTV